VQYFVKGKVEEIRRRGRRRRELLDDSREKRRYWNFKEEALVGSIWRSRFE
jgi:hypothetical protein